ncbi:MAG TPA: magnesium/cobalt transporter CorA, partial [Bacteroidales bacterium]|nr:magnesium/cobalt transporter CorA [Bacteroidales bacterium]
NDESMDITYKQISCILNDNILISFLEKQTNFFDPLKENIKNNRSNIRSKKPDFLLYNFLDLIIDSYFIILQEIEEKLGNIEDNLLEVNNNELTNQLHKLRTNISMLHRYIFPIVEITKNIETSNSKFINDTAFYYRDLYDHSYRIVESLENYREMTFNILQIYLSEVSTRMNEIMKMLTIIATIFIPLTFIVGVYGMNFKYMPELEYRYGYFIVWGVMIVIALLLIFYFKRKKWL